MLPLLGLTWKSALAVAALFGVLHLGSGRKSSFAVWYAIFTPRHFIDLPSAYVCAISWSLLGQLVEVDELSLSGQRL